MYPTTGRGDQRSLFVGHLSFVCIKIVLNLLLKVAFKKHYLLSNGPEKNVYK